MTPDVSVVLPTYNEAQTLPRMIERIAAAFRSMGINGEILVVDDNSPDGTGDLADSLSLKFPVRTIHRPGKAGLASAALAGFREASAPLIALMDSDGSHPPEALSAMEKILRERTDIDCVVGSRFVYGGETRGWPFYRHMASALARAVVLPLTSVRDSTSGFFMFRRYLVGRLREVGGFKIGLELFARVPSRKILEVPISFADRAAGKSKLGGGVIRAYLEQLVSLYRLKLTGKLREHAS